MNMKAQLLTIDAKETRLLWYCPGCKCSHGVPIPPSTRAWQWNGSLNAPTLSPSVLVKDRAEGSVCHCFIRAGRIEFLGDCSHDHAGKTVDMREES